MSEPVDPTSFLFVTLDSCRFDTFVSADLPNLSEVGAVVRAHAPGNFTYSSHAAMFMGFTPGDATSDAPFVNPKVGKIFRVQSAQTFPDADAFAVLSGRNVLDGLGRLGFRRIGTGAAGWFDTSTLTGQALTCDFDDFWHPGNLYSLRRQVAWILDRIHDRGPVFAFLNVGETHAPYYFDGAPWSPDHNPCRPFGTSNDADESRRRQRACLEHADEVLAPLLDAFAGANTVVCADHGDAWGEDGLWEHGIHHETVLVVPLILRLQNRPRPSAIGPLAEEAARAPVRLLRKMQHRLHVRSIRPNR